MLKEQSKTKTFEEHFIARAPKMSDLDDVLEMLEICDLTMMGEIEASADSLRTDWTNPTVSRERNFRVITTRNGRVVGYGELWDNGDPIVRAWHWARVHPEFEGQGIGTYLNNWGQKVARETMNKRAPKEARFTMDSGTVSTYQPAIDLFEGQGMRLHRHFYTMEIDFEGQTIAPPQLPDNLTIRAMTGPEELGAIVRAVGDSFQDHWGFVDNSFEVEYEFWSHIISTDPSFDASLWFLAMEGDQIAGISLCWPKHGANEKMAWVGALGVLRPWRRQGVGLALLHYSFAELQRRGKEKVGLGVDADSLTGATRLYEKAGMHAVRQFDQYEIELRPGVDMLKRTVED